MNDIDSTAPAAPGDEHLRARRAFLKAAPLGALALVAGAAPAAEAAPVAAAPAQPVSRGYHETEHIRRYYQTAAYW
jgi:hypothetical protein